MVLTESESARAKHFALDILKSAYAESSAVSFGGSPDASWPAIFRLASAESCLAALCDCVLSTRAGQLGLTTHQISWCAGSLCDWRDPPCLGRLAGGWDCNRGDRDRG